MHRKGSAQKPGTERQDLALARAILSIGRRSFPADFLASLQAVAQVDHVMVFGFRADDRAECLANAGAISIADDLGSAYTSHFHAYDPNKDAFFRAPHSGEAVRLRFAAPQTYPVKYRKIFFEDSGIVDKFATALWHEDRCFYVNFYRVARSGRFAPAELSRLEHTGAAFAATIARHFEALGAAQETDLPLPRRLERLFARTDTLAALSQRERDVCIKILIGYTSEAIALELGVSHSTVLTYRRRAYERLGIGSQNELFAQVLTLLTAPQWPQASALPFQQ